MTAPPPPSFGRDKAHQYLLERAFAADAEIRSQTLSVTDAMMLIAGLADVAQRLGAAIPAADATHQRQDAAHAAEVARAQAAEKAITDNLAAEVTRATQAEAALSARISALEARLLRGTTGTGTVSSLIAGTTNLTVTLKTPMPSADYIALPIIDATTGVNLSTVTATVTAKTASTVTVRVANSGLALLQTVNVTVIAVQLA